MLQDVDQLSQCREQSACRCIHYLLSPAHSLLKPCVFSSFLASASLRTAFIKSSWKSVGKINRWERRASQLGGRVGRGGSVQASLFYMLFISLSFRQSLAAHAQPRQSTAHLDAVVALISDGKHASLHGSREGSMRSISASGCTSPLLCLCCRCTSAANACPLPLCRCSAGRHH